MTALDLEPNVDAITNLTQTFLAAYRQDRSGERRPLELVSTLGGAASVAEDDSCTAIFAGGFFDRDELVRQFAGGQTLGGGRGAPPQDVPRSTERRS